MSTINELPSGPTVGLRLTDPATLGLIGSVLTAIVSTVWTSTGHTGLSSGVQVDLNTLVGLYATSIIGFKHFLQGKQVQAAIAIAKQVEAIPQVKAAVDQVATAVETAAPAADPRIAAAQQVIADAQAALDALRAPKGN